MDLPTWDGHGAYVEPLVKFAEEYKPKNVLEIGLGHWGFSTRVWLAHTEAQVTTVDKGDWKGAGAGLTNHYPDRFTFLKGLTDEVLPKLKREYDLIFIDGDHSYEGAKADILNCQKLVKKGGIILLDDVYVPFMSAIDVDEQGEPIDGMFGVGEAVKECFKGWEEVYTDIPFANGGKAFVKA